MQKYEKLMSSWNFKSCKSTKKYIRLLNKLTNQLSKQTHILS